VPVEVAVDEPVEVDAYSEADEFSEFDITGLSDVVIEGDEEELNDSKVEGLSDCFCAAEGDSECVLEIV